MKQNIDLQLPGSWPRDSQNSVYLFDQLYIELWVMTRGTAQFLLQRFSSHAKFGK